MIKNLFSKSRVAVISSITITVLTLLAVGNGAVLAWGPERETYTNEVPARYATFNSITDNVAVGDERNFVRVRELGTDDTYADEVEVTPGKEYEVYIYYHNNAASNTNASGFGMATNVRVASAYPTVLSVGERGMISGIISWSYVTPESPNDAQEGTVWDEAYLTTQANGTVLRYKTGTAVIHNAGAANGSVLPTNLFTKEGTPIGFNKLSGTLPGCAEYSGYITYTLVAENIDSELEKQVSVDGENWSDEVTVKPGDYVTYRVKFNNTGNTNLTNAIFKDTHDDGLTLRSGSTKVFDADNVDGKVIDDIIDISGYNMGDAAIGSLKQIIYQAQVSWDEAYCNKSLNNTITVSYNGEEQKNDNATVLVACEVKPEPEEPVEPVVEKNCKTNPEMEGCQQLPNTGPLEITLAVLVALGLICGGFYLYRTKRVLKKVENKVSGKDVEKKAEESGKKDASVEVKEGDKKEAGKEQPKE